jgi:hypothetical protein
VLAEFRGVVLVIMLGQGEDVEVPLLIGFVGISGI